MKLLNERIELTNAEKESLTKTLLKTMVELHKADHAKLIECFNDQLGDQSEPSPGRGGVAGHLSAFSLPTK